MVGIEAILIFFFCLIGCGITSWKLGKRIGIDGTLDTLKAEGYLDFAEDEA